MSKDAYLDNWPKYLPFPQAIGPSKLPVPNASSFDWPQAQFAPLYLPPGSRPYQPYHVRKPQSLPYSAGNNGIYPVSGSGWSGDTARPPRRMGWIAQAPKRKALPAVVNPCLGGDCSQLGDLGDCGCGHARRNPSGTTKGLMVLGAIAIAAYFWR